ncbi:MAG: sulfite exporter TauE/SafE family protein [Lutibacter sp.]
MLWTALILGLAGSFHCIGMCGPIAFVLPINRQSKNSYVLQIFLYHFGRILTYSFIGLLFGLLGKGLYLAGFQQNLSILMGALMILAALFPTKFFEKATILKPIYRLISQLKKHLGLYLNKKSNKALFLIGILNGFLPCGLVYMALMGAVSLGDFVNGSLYMALFGLGTIPMMTGAIALGNFVSISIRSKIQKIIPIFVVIIGLLFILRGLGLGIPYISPPNAKLHFSNQPKTCITVNKNE